MSRSSVWVSLRMCSQKMMTFKGLARQSWPFSFGGGRYRHRSPGAVTYVFQRYPHGSKSGTITTPRKMPQNESAMTEQRQRAKEAHPDAMPEIPRPRAMQDRPPRSRALRQPNQGIRSPEHVEAIERKLRPGLYLDHAYLRRHLPTCFMQTDIHWMK